MKLGRYKRAAFILGLLMVFSMGLGLRPALAVSGAGFTTVNESVDGTGHCKNGNPDVNCNIYDGKQYVWMNGGPLAAALGDGTYFFAVLVPGGQGGNNNPNDGTPLNLSDTTADPYPIGSHNADGSSIPSGDAYTNRTFTISGGNVSYSGTHDSDGNKIRLMPYDDTTNPGGVYIMAICSLAHGYPVNPSDCKYDAFKIQEGQVQNGLPLTITKDAAGAYDNTYAWTISKDVDKTLVKQAGSSATFTYTVTVSHDVGTISGVKVTGTIQVTNPNVDNQNNIIPVDIDGVTDRLSDGTVCTVNGGGAQTLTQFHTDFAYECDLSAVPHGELDNTATVDWSQQLLDNGALLDSGSANFMFSNISFAETKIDDSVTVTDTFNGATNTLGTVGLNDLNPQTFTYQRTVQAPAGTCQSYDNTATFTTDTTHATDSANKTVTACSPLDLTVSKVATPTFTRTYQWGIQKSVDKTLVKQVGGTATFTYTVSVTHDAGTDSNWAVSGTITVSNPNTDGQLGATGVNITDQLPGANCSVTNGTGLTIAAGQSAQVSYTCTYSSAPPSGTITNTGSASWDASLGSADTSATGTANFSFTTPTTIVDGSVTVTDIFNGGQPTTLGTVSYTDPSPTTFTYPRIVSVPTGGSCVSYNNTATFTTNTTGTTGSNSRTVTACNPLDLTVSKVATPTFTRTYHWGIQKSVDKTMVKQVGGTAIFTYTVSVTHDAGTDSNWAVSGTITVSNPNSSGNGTLLDASGVNITDQLPGATCNVTNGTGLTIAAGQSAHVSYLCTYSSAPPSGTITNTGSASWDASLGSAHTSATGTANFSFTTPTTIVDGSITVTDTFNRGSPTTLGTASYTDPSPKTFASYSRTVTVRPDHCDPYNNTATFTTNTTGSTGSASKTVTVCGAASGGLTMGFWKNPNGQSMIGNTTYSGAGCATLVGYLRGFLPFQDLSPSANCNAVKSYVSTIIGNANSSGTSMNPMLKAQMLATALDVYFSDPAHGDPIKGYNGNNTTYLGGVKIDLTSICNMIDGTGGSTCGGNYYNVSGAFGGAASLTVNQMLAYAASQSNVGGSTWYGQVKATQEMAKNAFDAINNQVAFTAP